CWTGKLAGLSPLRMRAAQMPARRCDGHAVTGVRVRDTKTGRTRLEACRGIFVYVGLEPNTAFVRGVLALDGAGHVEIDINMHTSLGGVFAAGDPRAHSVAQLAAAAGRRRDRGDRRVSVSSEQPKGRHGSLKNLPHRSTMLQGRFPGPPPRLARRRVLA